MYAGRIVAAGRTRSGANAALYRVSSRSFPNRQAVDLGGRLAIVPREGHEGDVYKNPYIAYNCLRIADTFAIATNGTQTDPVAEKIAAGTAPRDALVQALSTLDYEKDDYNTPRIAAVVPEAGDEAWLGIVRHDALLVRAVPLVAGRATWLSTYEGDEIQGPGGPQEFDFDAGDALEAARFVVTGGDFSKLTNPVTSAAALATARGFELATFQVP